jgi:O-antigen/teichoic acid export membrane protein
MEYSVNEKPKSQRSDIAYNAKIAVIAAILTTILATITRMAVPRYLGVTEMGHLTFAESWANLILSFGQLGVGTWLMKNVSTQKEVSRKSLFSALTMASVLMTFLWLIMNALIWLRHGAEANLWLSGTIGAFVALYLLQRGILRRNCIALGLTKFISKVEVFQKAITTIFVISILILRPSALNVAIAMLLPQFASILFALFYLARLGHFEISGSVQHSFEIAKQSLPFFAASIFVDITANIDVPVLEYLSSPYEVGLLGACLRIQGALFLLIPVLQTSAQPELARLFIEDKKEFSLKVKEVFRLVVLVAIFVGFGTVTFGSSVINQVYGASFQDAVPCLVALGPVTILTYVASFMGSTATMTSKSSSVAWQMFWAVAVNLVLSYCLIPIGLTYGAGHGASTAAIVTAITELFVVCGLWRALGVQTIPIKQMLHVFVAFPLCAALAYFVDSAAALSFFQKVTFFVIFFVSYASITGLIRLDDLKYLRKSRT